MVHRLFDGDKKSNKEDCNETKVVVEFSEAAAVESKVIPVSPSPEKPKFEAAGVNTLENWFTLGNSKT